MVCPPITSNFHDMDKKYKECCEKEKNKLKNGKRCFVFPIGDTDMELMNSTLTRISVEDCLQLLPARWSLVKLQGRGGREWHSMGQQRLGQN